VQPSGEIMPYLSVVVPAFNEAEGISLSLDRLYAATKPLDDVEYIVVDDGSTDATALCVQEWSGRHDNVDVTLIRLQRNFGHMAALDAGMEIAEGEFIVTIDADMQDPPELIPTMLQVAQANGLDVVQGVRADRASDSRFKRHSASAFYALMAKMSDTPVEIQGGDFRLVRRSTLDRYLSLRERTKVPRFAFAMMGARYGKVCYAREPRRYGQTHYSVGRMVTLAVDSVLSVSQRPLYLALQFSLVLLTVACVGGALAIIAAIAGWTVPGWASTVLTVSLFGSIQMLMLCVFGVYIAKIHTEVLSRPRYWTSDVWRTNSR
jgi:glycosyltransferase involved in cell wall biosynthesis